MKTSFLLLLFSALVLSSCSLVSKEVATASSQPYFDVPNEVAKYDCPESPHTECYKNADDNKTLDIAQINGSLETIIYSDPPAGLSYKYYPKYDRWLDNFTMEVDTTNMQEKIDCLDAKFGNKKSVSISLLPVAYAAGGEFDCDTFIQNLDQETHMEMKKIPSGLSAYIFSSGDGPGSWKTAYVENPDKTKTYEIVCSASDPFLTDAQGNAIEDTSWFQFIDQCIDTVLGSWKFE